MAIIFSFKTLCTHPSCIPLTTFFFVAHQFRHNQSLRMIGRAWRHSRGAEDGRRGYDSIHWVLATGWGPNLVEDGEEESSRHQPHLGELSRNISVATSQLACVSIGFSILQAREYVDHAVQPRVSLACFTPNLEATEKDHVKRFFNRMRHVI